jgi:hypothetical protein
MAATALEQALSRLGGRLYGARRLRGRTPARSRGEEAVFPAFPWSRALSFRHAGM